MLNDTLSCSQEWREVRKKEAANKAIFTCTNKDTGKIFEFNAFDDLWQIDDIKFHPVTELPLKSSFIDLCFIDDKELSHKEQEIIRYAMAHKLSSGRNIQPIISTIQHLQLKSLTISGFTYAFNNTTYVSYRRNLKSVALWLKEYDAITFSELYKEISKLKAKKPKQNPWDIRTGALSNFEKVEIALKTNEWAKIVLDEKEFNNWFEEQKAKNIKHVFNVNHIKKLNQFFTLRFSDLYGLRPRQIKLILWSSFIAEDNNSPFLFEGEGLLYTKMVKQQDDESIRPDGAPKIVSAEFAQELNSYRFIFKNLLQTNFSNAGFIVTDEEIFHLMENLPLIISESIFKEATYHKSKDSLLYDIKNKNWLSPSDNIQNYLNQIITLLNPDSDRVPKSDYRINFTRFRHSIGTTLLIEGYPKSVISLALDHLYSRSVSSYFDIPADIQAEIDKKRDDVTFLIAAANGDFANELKERITIAISENETAIEELKCGELGKSASLPMCASCSKTKPISCYGCLNFKPLASANHRKILKKVESEYEEKKRTYKRVHLASYENIIRKIQITIIYCDEKMASLNLSSEKSQND